ncbi:mitochondrial 54S ribosomal protein mrpl1 [Chamberlinius hualienensis]
MAAPWRASFSLLKGICAVNQPGSSLTWGNSWTYLVNQIRWFPARKSTREKRDKIKRAYKLRMASQIKKDEVPETRKWASKSQMSTRTRTNMFHATREVEDDCWIAIHHKRQLFPIAEVIEMFRETHHPTIFNKPQAPLFLSLELNMTLDKKNRFLEAFNGVVKLPHYFDDGILKTIVAFCKTEEDQTKALTAGADMAGGNSLIKKVLSGEVLLPDFKYVVSHSDIISDLSSLRGIMKKKYPTIAKGSLGSDISSIVNRYKTGLEYNAIKDPVHHDFAWIDVPVGTLNMDSQHLEENIATLVSTACTHRPTKFGTFITVALLTCPPSKEKLAINISKYEPKAPVDADDDDDDDDEVKTRKSRG